MKINPKIEKIIEDIKELRIQGARNVAKEIVRAFVLYIKEEDEKNFMENAIKFAIKLMDLRPTEPMTRNIMKEVVNYLLNTIEKGDDVEKVKEFFSQNEDKILEKFYESIERIADIGANYIEEGSTVMTYCHSSTVTTILKKAHEYGKISAVYSCETRPRFQGRITTKELAEYGIKTIHIVDGAMARFMKKVDVVVVGADAITSTGDLINKIGSLSLAIVADYYKKPFISAAELYKYDPETMLGLREKIEERDTKEVWGWKNENMTIKNPAFDLVPNELIDKYITDVGIIAPSDFKESFEKNKERFILE